MRNNKAVPFEIVEGLLFYVDRQLVVNGLGLTSVILKPFFTYSVGRSTVAVSHVKQ